VAAVTQVPSNCQASRLDAKAVLRVVFVGKVSEGDERDRVAVAHQHKVGHLVPYLEIQ